MNTPNTAPGFESAPWTPIRRLGAITLEIEPATGTFRLVEPGIPHSETFAEFAQATRAALFAHQAAIDRQNRAALGAAPLTIAPIHALPARVPPRSRAKAIPRESYPHVPALAPARPARRDGISA